MNLDIFLKVCQNVAFVGERAVNKMRGWVRVTNWSLLRNLVPGQKFTQIGAWCNMIRFSTFRVALTTLCRINLDFHMYYRIQRFLSLLQGFGGSWKVLLKPTGHFSCCMNLVDVIKGKTRNHRSHQKPTFGPANFHYSDYVMREYAILARFSWSNWRSLNMNFEGSLIPEAK